MKLILLSGGSGTRLWPLSDDIRAKQFLKVLRNEETGQLESMLQRVYRQVSKVFHFDDIVIATNQTQVDLIYNQIGKVQTVLEPQRRNTFAAISLATSYLCEQVNASLDDTIGVISVDTFVDVHFYTLVRQLEDVLHRSRAEVALLAVKPTYASSKYGYIVPKFKQGDYIEVDSFVEKPKEQLATSLIKKGAYWNSGVFAFQGRLLQAILKSKNINFDYSCLQNDFTNLPNNSFDYEVVEHLTNIAALPYEGYWKDLGTWNTLTEEMDNQIFGECQLSYDCDNVHVINELHLPVKVLGISNAVIAVSPNGILVSDKSASPRLKEVLDTTTGSIPMYMEYNWGNYYVIDFSKKESQTTITKKVEMFAGSQWKHHCESNCSKHFTVLFGQILFTTNNENILIKSGMTFQVCNGTDYTIYAHQDSELIETEILKN